MTISQLEQLTDEDRGAVAAAAQVVEQLTAVLREVPCEVARPVRAGLAPQGETGR
ncbi:hypothetical protein ABZ923_09570 [Streptomyces sp. NPDC046881]|uniref:hypothetical protein n=1 Tax=Streptomyces sp. NPDC046881 TaxID=3155374 RepID=UPI0033C42E4C